MKFTCKTAGISLVLAIVTVTLSGCTQVDRWSSKAMSTLPFPKRTSQQAVTPPQTQVVRPQQAVPVPITPQQPVLQSQGQVFNPIQVSPQVSPQYVQGQPTQLTNPVFGSPTFVQRGNKPRVALLLPTGARGNVGTVAKQMRNAALLARDDAGSLIDLNFYDTQAGGASSVTEATSRALNEGAELILGPLLGGNIGQVAAQANGRNVNVLSFSNDLSQARPGAFLLGIAPDLAVQQVISFASQRGSRNIAVLMPRSSYGTRALSAAQSTAQQSGLRILGPFTYDAKSGSDDRKTAVKALADQIDQFDTILIADNAQSSREMAALLVFNQIDISEKKVLGTNLWIDPVVSQEAGMRGAWFAAAPESDWVSFQSRYASRFGQSPEKVAGIAYDAAKLASDLVSKGQAFDTNSLTTSAGFSGLFGAYRLSPSGYPIRSMDIHEVRSVGSVVLQQAAGFTNYGF